VLHHSIIKQIGQVPDILPSHILRDFTNKQLLDARLQAVDEVKLKVGLMAVREVDDDALKLISKCLDRGDLFQLPEAATGFGGWVRVAKMGC
jgi:hypothetical protein